MFGFSIGKLLVLAVILFAVIYGAKWIARTGIAQRSSEDEDATASRIDMVYDSESDSYVPKSTQKRSDKN